MKVRKMILIICGMVLMSGNALAQNNGIDRSTETQKMENYTSEVLIVGKWGSRLGEYKYNMNEGDIDYPRNFIVDDKEHIYILDQYNNRVQYYNAKGKLLGKILIDSHKRATMEEWKKWNHGYPYAIRLIEHFKYIEGEIYAVQSKRSGAKRTYNLLKLKNRKFIKVNKQKEKNKIHKKMSILNKKEEMKQHFKNDEKFKVIIKKTNFGFIERLFYDGIEMQSPALDKDNNVWFSNGRIIKKYSPEGKLLFEMPRNRATRIISKQGNLYLMSLYSTKPGTIADYCFGCYEEGIIIKKIILEK